LGTTLLWNNLHQVRSKSKDWGVAPLRIETGRYENKNVNERVCFICHDQIEDEKHVLLDNTSLFQKPL
jgi:hypothetical protein